MADLLTKLETLTELSDGSASEGESPTYFEVDADLLREAIEAIRSGQALRARIESSAAEMVDLPTGRFIAGHMRSLLDG